MRTKTAYFKSNHIARRSVLILIAVTMSVTSTLASFTSVSADNNAIPGNSFTGLANKMAPEDQARSFAYYKYMRQCFSYGNYSTFVQTSGTTGEDVITAEKAPVFDWFATASIISFQTAKVGVINNYTPAVINVTDDSVQDCFQDTFKAIMSAAAPLWGYSSGSQLLCDLGFKPNGVKESRCAGAGETGWNYTPPSDVTGSIDNWYRTKIGFKSTSLDAIEPTGGKYMLYLRSFQAYCIKEGVLGTAYENIAVYEPPSETPKIISYDVRDSTHKADSKVNLYEGEYKTCDQLAAELKEVSPPNSLQLGIKAWIGKNKANGQIGSNKCSDADYAEHHPLECNPEGSTTSCGIASVGWMVCPVIGFLGSITDGIFGFVTTLLTLNPSFTSGVNTRNASQAVLNIANVGLVIVFLWIIFSQLTGFGITNYGVKKMLPRLVIAAIAMQISMYLCAIAVDVSNIVGSSTYDLLVGTANSATDHTILICADGSTVSDVCADGSTSVDPGSIGDAGASTGFFAAIAGVAVVTTGAVLWGSVGLLIPVLLAALVAIAVTLGILLMRWVLVVVLVILAPVAILAMVLPNTQKLFTAWRKWFIAMLAVYVMVALLFGGAKLVAVIIGGALGDMGIHGIVAGILAGAVMVLPLFFTPKLLQGSLQAIPIVGGMAQKLTGSANGKLSGARKQMAQGSNFAKTLQARRMGRLENNKKAFERTAAGEYKRDKNGHLIMKNGLPQRSIRSRALGAMLIGNKTATKNTRKMGSLGATQQEFTAIERQLQEEKVRNPGYSAQDTRNYHSLAATTGYRYNPNGTLVTDAAGHPIALSTAEHAAHIQHLSQTDPGRTILQEIANGNMGADADARQLAVEQLGIHNAGVYNAQTGQVGGNNPGGGAGTPPPPPPPPSDKRLKTDIKYLKTLASGIKLYSFKYLWSEQVYVGVMAQDILLTHPDAVIVQDNSYYAVRYWQLGLRMVTLEQYNADPACCEALLYYKHNGNPQSTARR